MSNPPTEEEVRALREEVYGVECSEAEWRSVGPRWMKPENIEWLKEKAERPLP